MKTQLNEDAIVKQIIAEKVWKSPELMLISKGYLESGANPGAHEANFTPNHNHYISSKSGHSFVVPTGFFGKYVS